jgi:hypothetical protein
VDQRCIGSGWATWSHEYTGDIYFSNYAKSQSITLPAGTKAFYFYVEPNSFALYNFKVVADGASSGSFTAHGSNGAKYVGVYNSDPAGTVSNIRIECDDPNGFASGEYGWSGGGGCTGAIGGIVTVKEDPIARAIVLAVRLPDKEKAGAVTGERGDYIIPDLPPATYLVLCLKTGYGPGVAFPVEVKCDVTAKLPFELVPAVE